MITPALKRRLLSIIILLPVTIFAIIEGELIFKIFVAIAFGIAVKEWIRMTRKTDQFWRDAILGCVYMTICFMTFIFLRTEFDQGIFFTVTLLFGVWASDSAAYFSGKLIGGPKLAPKISPNKTWAGFIGGTIGSGVILVLFDYFVPYFSNMAGLEVLPFAPLGMAFVIGALFTVFGQIGDLGMSLYKRKAGVKDTGTLIPGHGGLLDRIDSLMLVTPFFYLVLHYLAS